MKRLILVRHAKSSWDHPDLTDIERPINKRGKRDAPFMAELLKKLNIMPDVIYSSPAVRALSTAEIFSDTLGYAKQKIIINENIYDAGLKELSILINGISDEYNTVFLFGHNPGLTYFANHLGNQFIDNMPTCSIAAFEFGLDKWENVERGTGNISLFEFPKKYFS